MNMIALATHARRYVEDEYHATISTQDAHAVAAAAVNFHLGKDQQPNLATFLKSTSVGGKPLLEEAVFHIVTKVL
jgi:hypothetical protein